MSSTSIPDFDLLPHDAPGKASVAYDHLKYAAINGKLRPGRRLAPQDLTDFYRVSATPIRDAMVQLAIEGFIEREAGRGFAVKPFSVEDQGGRLEMCFFSLSFSLETLDELPQALLEDMAALDAGALGEGPGGADRVARKVEMVFAALASATRNSTLNALTRAVVDQTHFVRLIDFEDAATRERMLERLKRFAEAIKAGDRDRAREIFRDKLRERLTRMPDLVQKANLAASTAGFP